MKINMLSGDHHCGTSDWCGWWFLLSSTHEIIYAVGGSPLWYQRLVRLVIPLIIHSWNHPCCRGITTVVPATGAAGDSSNHPLMKSSMLSGDHHCGISDWCGWWFLKSSWCFELTSVNAFFRLFFNMVNVTNIIIFFFIHTLTHYVITRFLRFPDGFLLYAVAILSLRET